MNEKYFKMIYKKYFKVLHAYSFRIISKEDAAEDIVQEVFMECWERRQTIDLTESLKPFLYTLTRRKSIDYLRKSDSKNLLFSQVGTNLDQFMFETLILEDNYDTQEMIRIVEESILSLPPKCREVFKLSRENEMKNKQIAETLNLSIKSVEKHISKAIKQIRQALEENGYILDIVLYTILLNCL